MDRTPHGEPAEPDVLAWLTRRISDYASREISPETPLSECGLDSVAVLSLFGDIEEGFGSLIDPDDIWAYASVRALAHHITVCRSRLGDGGRIRPAFVFGGQGAQHPCMTAGLHRDSAVYRACLTRADEALRPYLGCSVAEVILSGGPDIDRTALSHSAVFAVGYALAETLLDAGVRPVAVVGHGVGELTAAVTARALPLAEAAQLVALRGQFIQDLPDGGGMLAVCADPDEAADVIAGEPEVYIGAINAARATVLSGRLDALARVRDALSAAGLSSRFLSVGHAYHSPCMNPVAPRLRALARRFPGSPPAVAYYSPVYGRQWTERLGADYWAVQVTSPVRFAAAVRRMLSQDMPTHVVEIGPRPVLTPFVRRIDGAAGPRCLPVCRGPETDVVDLAGVLSALDAGPLAEDSMMW
ncbi:acyltransferase domain-containing protein [Streptomyces hygroscopicus]|uniref:acyltransferase domain-containing protein n=1 Tax=Streptomyces hygroscopicus TaxID=1912 RepID=UPI00223EB58A|nr:acyltransferase domain-containing protein [Streptomyces hygroscopicus]